MILPLVIMSEKRLYKNMKSDITFIENPIVSKSPADYEDVLIDVKKAIKSYQLSLFSYEVMHNSGALRSDEDLNDRQASLRRAILKAIENKESLKKPVAGIGINDNFELGSGRDTFMTLAVLGWHQIPVHIRKNQRKELASFIVKL